MTRQDRMRRAYRLVENHKGFRRAALESSKELAEQLVFVFRRQLEIGEDRLDEAAELHRMLGDRLTAANAAHHDSAIAELRFERIESGEDTDT